MMITHAIAVQEPIGAMVGKQLVVALYVAITMRNQIVRIVIRWIFKHDLTPVLKQHLTSDKEGN